jgi:hypothetical protein
MEASTKAERITKLDAAKRQLTTAIRLFFEDDDPVSVYTLAHASLEILGILCKRAGKERYIQLVAEKYGLTEMDARPIVSYGKNFFKHADRDPDAVLEDFADTRNDGILMYAIVDLFSLFEENYHALPHEVLAFRLWYSIAHPETCSEDEPGPGTIEATEKWFPDFRSKSRTQLKHDAMDVIDSIQKRPSTWRRELRGAVKEWERIGKASNRS